MCKKQIHTQIRSPSMHAPAEYAQYIQLTMPWQTPLVANTAKMYVCLTPKVRGTMYIYRVLGGLQLVLTLTSGIGGLLWNR